MRIIAVGENGAVTITDRFGNDIDTSGDFSNLQPGKYVILGAYQGTVATGTSSNDIVLGTDHGDVLYGYSNSGDSHAEVSNDKIYGNGGDDLIDAGAGNNMWTLRSAGNACSSTIVPDGSTRPLNRTSSSLGSSES